MNNDERLLVWAMQEAIKDMGLEIKELKKRLEAIENDDKLP